MIDLPITAAKIHIIIVVLHHYFCGFCAFSWLAKHGRIGTETKIAKLSNIRLVDVVLPTAWVTQSDVDVPAAQLNIRQS